MKWNEYAKVGDALFKKLRRMAFGDATSCDFVFEILDRLKLDEGYRLVAKAGIRYCDLYAVKDEMMWAFSEATAEEVEDSEKYDLWSHITIERSEMGAWQAKLLERASCVMPLEGYESYQARNFVFSTAGLSSLKNKGSFDYKKYVGDTRLLPSVEMDGNVVTMRHCHWNDWEGLVLRTDHLEFGTDGQLSDKGGNEEVLFGYDCGVRFYDAGPEWMWVRERPKEDGISVVEVIYMGVTGRYRKEFGRSSDEEELAELVEEALEWINDYDEFLNEYEKAEDYDDDEYDSDSEDEGSDDFVEAKRWYSEEQRKQCEERERKEERRHLEELLKQREEREREEERRYQERQQRRHEERERKEEEKRRAKEEDDKLPFTLWIGRD